MYVRHHHRHHDNNCTPHLVSRMVRMTLVLVVLSWITISLWSLTGSQNSSGNSSIRRSDRNVLSLHLDVHPLVSVRIRLYAEEAPAAARYIHTLVDISKEHNGVIRNCTKCNNIYRGEPVPTFWGDPSLPDRWDGGRWGPPYALIQGQFGPSKQDGMLPPPPPAESHRPEIQRGMIAWAGGGGGPHFFVALANHPEWKTSHTVFGEVESEKELEGLQNLLETRALYTTRPKRPPTVTNFVEPIPFSLQ